MSDLITTPYNQILAQKHGMIRRALRYALAPMCDPSTGEPRMTKAQLRRQLRTVPIVALTLGDNILIPAGIAGAKEIFELVLWNVTAQTIALQQGLTAGGNAVPWFRLTDFPDKNGYTLGFNGSFEQPHFEVDNLQPLVMNLQNGTEVDGFLRYRVNNATS